MEGSRAFACACRRLCSSVFRHFATWLRWVLGLSEFQRASAAKASNALRPSRPSRVTLVPQRLCFSSAASDGDAVTPPQREACGQRTGNISNCGVEGRGPSDRCIWYCFRALLRLPRLELRNCKRRAALSWRQFWNLKDNSERDTTMNSRLAFLHLAVIPVLQGCRDLDTLMEIVQVNRMCGNRRRPGERWLERHLRKFRRARARADAMGLPRADKMVTQKRWSCAGHVARIWTSIQTIDWLLGKRDITWWRDNKRRWRGSRHFHRRPGTQRRWTQHFDGCWHNFGLDWKTVSKDRPTFDAGMKEFTKIHEAQSRKIKDEDDATWI